MCLAQKAPANSRMGAIQIAQNLVIKKLGDLAGTASATPVKNTNTEDFDLYAEHFVRPVEKATMDAIQDLIEHSAMIQKKSNDQGLASEAPGAA